MRLRAVLAVLALGLATACGSDSDSGVKAGTWEDRNYEAQVEVIAKNKGVPTPYARNFNASFNDPQSPWLETVRGALFGEADKALSDGNTAITESLQQGS